MVRDVVEVRGTTPTDISSEAYPSGLDCFLDRYKRRKSEIDTQRMLFSYINTLVSFFQLGSTFSSIQQ